MGALGPFPYLVPADAVRYPTPHASCGEGLLGFLCRGGFFLARCARLRLGIDVILAEALAALAATDAVLDTNSAPAAFTSCPVLGADGGIALDAGDDAFGAPFGPADAAALCVFVACGLPAGRA